VSDSSVIGRVAVIWTLGGGDQESGTLRARRLILRHDDTISREWVGMAGGNSQGQLGKGAGRCPRQPKARG